MYLPRRLCLGLMRLVDGLQGRGVWRAFQSLERSQWWEPGRLARLQEDRLQKLLVDAGRRSPYYQDLFLRHGIQVSGPPHQILSRLPVLERETLRREQERLRGGGFGPGEALPNSTGGSTGVNVPFWVDRACWRQRDAVALRLYTFLGLCPGDRVANVWGSPMDMRAATRFKERIRRLVDNRRLFSAYKVGEDDVDGILRWLEWSRPDLLMGYASVLDTLARRAEHLGGIRGPRVVISAAEVLYDEQRDRIQRAFGAEVFNQYGCREVGLIALECSQHAGLHIMDERLVLERDSHGGAGELGSDLLVTDLDNRATPLIRYRIGDLVQGGGTERCGCGRGLSRLGQIAGRTFDIVRGPGGRAVGGTFWSLLLRTAVRGVESFQVVQIDLRRIEVRVTPRGALGKEGRRTVIDKVQGALGREVEVAFVEMEALEPLASGKHRFVYSQVRPEGSP